MKPVFAKKMNKGGLDFYTIYSNTKSNAVISIGGQNLVLEGQPAINLRLGNSKFGEEIIFELIINKDSPPRILKGNSKTDKVEIYLLKDIGLKVLEMAIKRFKEA